MTLWNVPVLGTEIWDQISGLLDPNTHSRIALWSEVNGINFHNFISKKATNISLSEFMLVKDHTSNRTMNDKFLCEVIENSSLFAYLSPTHSVLKVWNVQASGMDGSILLWVWMATWLCVFVCGVWVWKCVRLCAFDCGVYYLRRKLKFFPE